MEEMTAKKKVNVLAIVTLVLGILGALCCNWLSPVAVILGIVSLTKEKNVMAIIGLVLGALGIIWWIVSALFLGPVLTEMFENMM